MTKEEVYRSAVRVVEQRRQAAETAALRSQQQLYQQLPDLQRLDGEKNEAGAAAAALAASGASRDVIEEKLALVEKLAAQKAALLARAGKTEKDLEPHYHCEKCGDTGRVKGRVCSCVQEEVRSLRRDEVNKSGPLRLCRFESFSLEYYPKQLEESGSFVEPRRRMEEMLQYCMDWAEEFGPFSRSLYMFGNAGLGKTHLALSIASRVLDKGYDVIYVSAQSAFSLVAGDRQAGGELFAAMLEADLLVLDDLGTEYITPYVLAKLYELVNGRMARRPTIYTSNICSRDILDGRYEEKISSRLLGECELLRFWGEDVRLQRR